MPIEHDDTPTCGKGVAASAGLPAILGQLMAARAEVLSRHRKALDLSDPAGRQEDEAYAALVTAHQDVAGALERLSAQMRSARDLPMGRHDIDVMMEPNGQMAAFREFVRLERELVAMLNSNLAEEERMLDA